MATLNYTINRLNEATQTTFLLGYKNKALRVATSDTWTVMNKGNKSNNMIHIFLVCQELQTGFFVMLIGESNQRPHEVYYR